MRPSLTRRLSGSRFLQFCVVGAGGFVVDSGVFWLAHDLAGLDIYVARAISIAVAMTYSWWGNRSLTFRDRAAKTRKAMAREWLAFTAANGLGALANYLSFAALVTFAPWPFGHRYVALVIGTAAGLVFNFTLSGKLVFRAHK